MLTAQNTADVTAIIFPELSAFIILPFQLMHFLSINSENNKSYVLGRKEKETDQKRNKKENCRMFLLKTSVHWMYFP